jgi:hypothetical protein
MISELDGCVILSESSLPTINHCPCRLSAKAKELCYLPGRQRTSLRWPFTPSNALIPLPYHLPERTSNRSIGFVANTRHGSSTPGWDAWSRSQEFFRRGIAACSKDSTAGSGSGTRHSIAYSCSLACAGLPNMYATGVGRRWQILGHVPSHAQYPFTRKLPCPGYTRCSRGVRRSSINAVPRHLHRGRRRNPNAMKS